MTGFGRAELIDEEKKITVEMKSVNHRYLDINMRMPKKFSVFEASIRSLLKEYIQRGKVDVFITCEEMCIRDRGIIDKFFVQFELGWKVLKELLSYEGQAISACLLYTSKRNPIFYNVCSSHYGHNSTLNYWQLIWTWIKFNLYGDYDIRDRKIMNIVREKIYRRLWWKFFLLCPQK